MYRVKSKMLWFDFGFLSIVFSYIYICQESINKHIWYNIASDVYAWHEQSCLGGLKAILDATSMDPLDKFQLAVAVNCQP